MDVDDGVCEGQGIGKRLSRFRHLFYMYETPISKSTGAAPSGVHVIKGRRKRMLCYLYALAEDNDVMMRKEGRCFVHGARREEDTPRCSISRHSDTVPCTRPEGCPDMMIKGKVL